MQLQLLSVAWQSSCDVCAVQEAAVPQLCGKGLAVPRDPRQGDMLQPTRQHSHMRCAPPFIHVSAAGPRYCQALNWWQSVLLPMTAHWCTLCWHADKLQLRTEVRNSSPDHKRDIELCIDPNNPRILLLLPRRQGFPHTATLSGCESSDLLVA